MAAGAEAVDDDLSRQRDVEVGRRDGGGVEIVKHLRCLVIASVKKVILPDNNSKDSWIDKKNIPCKQKELSPDFCWGRGKHVKIVEGPLISEAAKLSITHNLFVSLLSEIKY